MQAVSGLVKESIPNYLSSLPIPDSFGGWFSLGVGDWVRLVPFGICIGGMSYLGVRGLTTLPTVGPILQEKLSKVPGFKPSRVNQAVKMDQSKVVDNVDIEDIGDKAVFCRCWRSKKFPYCDGSHNKHNNETGDNVGPLIVKKSS